MCGIKAGFFNVEWRHTFRILQLLLCVSRASGMVQQLCDRAIWPNHGGLIMSGWVFEVTEAYAGRAATAQ